ncbi:MAG: HupE/UreJ family protein, partial [Terriglobales bacterium]
MSRAVLALFTACVLMCAGEAAQAHANGASVLRIESDDRSKKLVATWDIAAADLQLPLELDADGDGAYTADEISARRAAIERFAGSRLGIRRGGADCRLSVKELSSRLRESQAYVSLRLQGTCLRAGALAVTTDLFFGSRGYSTLLDVQTPNGRFAAALSMGSASWTEPRAASMLDGFLRFLREGVWHVLIGYDHIAFLLLLLLPSVLRGTKSGWTAAESGREVIRDLLKIVTAFTIAHSV